MYSALIGNPVEQSVTPALYGALAAQIGLDYAHLKVPVTEPERLSEIITALEAIGSVGVNVTIPYKVAVMPLLDSLAPSADIGAVNTVVFQGGKRIGHNTDRLGAAKAIDDTLRPVGEGDRIVMLGAGGAARAFVGIARERGARLAVLSPWPEECTALVDDMDPEREVIDDAGALTDETLVEHVTKADFLINATPVGGAGGPTGTLVGPAIFDAVADKRDLSHLNVFDVVYAPPRTALLDAASRAGAQTGSGLWMLINQGVESFGLFTGRDPGVFDRAPLFALLAPDEPDGIDAAQ